jgi:hypothetical protein
MTVTFDLSAKDYVCMITKVSTKSPAFATLRDAGSYSRSDGTAESIYFTVHCDEFESDLFLQIAKDHCLDAVSAIEQAIETARPVSVRNA